jgi:dienelactone hydrolase
MGRDRDELQGIFRVSYDLLKEAGKPCQWKSYDHDLHGFVFPVREQGEYQVDAMQRQAFDDVLTFFKQHLKA